jgi:hypothetical protein
MDLQHLQGLIMDLMIGLLIVFTVFLAILNKETIDAAKAKINKTVLNWANKE